MIPNGRSLTRICLLQTGQGLELYGTIFLRYDVKTFLRPFVTSEDAMCSNFSKNVLYSQLHSFTTSSLYGFLPKDGPPPNLLGAPYRTWKGFTPIYPELTGLGETATLFIVPAHFTVVLSLILDELTQLKCFLISMFVQNKYLTIRLICSFHFFSCFSY